MSAPKNSVEDLTPASSALGSSDFDEIFDLLEGLRSYGFRFGTQQYIDLHRVLATLITESKSELTEEKLKTYLAPIICTSPEEQDTFYSQFDIWLYQRMPKEGTKKPKPSELAESLAKHDKKNRFRQRLSWSLLFGVLTVSIISLTFLPNYLTRVLSNYLYPVPTDTIKVGTINGQVLDEENTAPLGNAEILFNNGSQRTDRKTGEFTVDYTTFEETADLVVNVPNYPIKIEKVTLHGGEQNITIRVKKAIQTVEGGSQAVQNVISKQNEPKDPGGDQPAPRSQVGINPADTKVNIASATISYWQEFYRTNFNSLITMAALAPFSYFLLWWLLRRRSRARLHRETSEETPRLSTLVVKGVTDLLYKSAALRNAIQELRRHRPLDSPDLNVTATIDATINSGGLPTPVLGVRKTSPEYLILIDRANFSDQETLLKEILINRLVEEGVYVDRYYFNRDPRFCYKSPESKILSLPELAARHPAHSLTIFSDAAGFLDPLTARPQRWLEMFSLWVRRALLTPASLDSWGYQEKILTEADFAVLPANKEGISALVEVINTGRTPRFRWNTKPRRFPEILAERPVRWLDRHSPGQTEIDKLYRQLRFYLNPGELYLLCACAVYPEISLELTLYLGYKLGHDVESLEDQVFSLVRLPWFRSGNMPEWLRQKLVSALTTDQENEIRKILEELLLTAIEHPEEGLTLEFAFDPQNYKKSKSKLRRFILGEPPDSPLRDYVFLSFITRDRLSVVIPEILRRILFPEGLRWLGLRPSMVLFVVLLVSVCGVSATAYFLPAPLIDEVNALSVDGPPVAAFPRMEPFLTYSPSTGLRGKQYTMVFTSTSCAEDKLTNAKLDAAEGSGIAVRSIKSKSDCEQEATIVIDKAALLGAQNLILSAPSGISESIQFTVTDKGGSVPVIPKPVPPRDPCTYVLSGVSCPATLYFRDNDAGETVSDSISLTADAFDTLNRVEWSVDSQQFTIISTNPRSAVLKALNSFRFLQEVRVSCRVYSADGQVCKTASCTTKVSLLAELPPLREDPSPTPTPEGKSPVSFAVYYQFEDPGKGWRYWKRLSSTSWTETYPDGTVSYFKVIGRLTNVFGNDGTLVAKIKGGLGDTDNDGSFQVFIPDIGSANMSALFRHGNGAWSSLGEMTKVTGPPKSAS